MSCPEMCLFHPKQGKSAGDFGLVELLPVQACIYRKIEGMELCAISWAVTEKAGYKSIKHIYWLSFKGLLCLQLVLIPSYQSRVKKIAVFRCHIFIFVSLK